MEACGTLGVGALHTRLLVEAASGAQQVAARGLTLVQLGGVFYRMPPCLSSANMLQSGRLDDGICSTDCGDHFCCSYQAGSYAFAIS